MLYEFKKLLFKNTKGKFEKVKTLFFYCLQLILTCQ